MVKAALKNPNAGVIYGATEPSKEELEFKAAWFHDLWIDQKKKDGFHYIDFHSNPMLTPPPLRDDGKSRCDQCNLMMGPYSTLSEKVKDLDRSIVLGIPKCEDAWRKRNG